MQGNPINGCARTGRGVNDKQVIRSRVHGKKLAGRWREGQGADADVGGRQLEREGFEVTYLEPTNKGIIEPEMVADAIREDTILVSIMHVNNEIGVINDIAAIGEITRAKKIVFHVDAAQSAGKVDLDLET